MSKKRYYIYNSETDTYEPVIISGNKRALIIINRLVSGILVGVCLFAVLMHFFGSPKERKISKERDLLTIKYDIMSKRLDEALLVLNDMRQRDDNLYRVILQGDPISLETRKASMGLAKYEDLMNLKDADLAITTNKKMDYLRRQLYIQSNSLEEITELCKTHEDKLKKIPAIQPVSNKDLKQTASGFGWRVDPIYQTRRFHQGMDFSAPIGTPVYVTGDGTVKKAGYERGYGNVVYIDHGYGYVTVYAHLSKILIRKGAKVTRGTEIAHVGNTGKSTGPHLHYEVHYNGNVMNPMHYYFLDLSPEEYEAMTEIADNNGLMFD